MKFVAGSIFGSVVVVGMFVVGFFAGVAADEWYTDREETSAK